MTSTEAGMIANLAMHYMPRLRCWYAGCDRDCKEAAIKKVFRGFPELGLNMKERHLNSIIARMDAIADGD